MNLDALTQREQPLFYSGEWHSASSDKTINVIDPSTAEIFSTLNSASAEDVSSAVESATTAWKSWRDLGGKQRAFYLNKFAEGLTSRKDELMQLQMKNNGKPAFEAEIDVEDAISCFKYYATLAENLDQQQNTAVELPDNDFSAKTRLEPVGPVGLIVPWNFPLVTSAWKIAPALAAGCTVVMKNSEVTPLIELVYGDIAIEANLPAGVLNLVVGAAETGIALVKDQRLQKISFTGSNHVGAMIMSDVSTRTLPISLELGGKSPIVILKDADIDLAVEVVCAGIFFNCGQMCSATSRLIVHKSIAEQVINGVVEKSKEMNIGSPNEADIEMGPLTSEAQLKQVQKYFQMAKDDQIECLVGGDTKQQKGYFVEPTVYKDVPQDHPIWREEIFGPVLATRTFTTEEEAIALSNDTHYGLVATIVSKDAEKAEYFASQIEAGHIWINAPQVIYPQTTWGGFKQSGIGRELGPWGLNAYLGVKNITIAN
ncbi:aldehyde dehydrogenase family protein [Cocleimonas flava]|uniref:Betaine-aldehyde dehydrogenase n=1 Tax=Cocleimonas flava TaxID=634765 RepID=A0A4R1EPX4_9GAMM|nr:aldehyde dehydrogenase family protein [Cocleimonas flava]TCJ83063.1 betaine-aldehyde dehydrogenase [Cocleimonas flava]